MSTFAERLHEQSNLGDGETKLLEEIQFGTVLVTYTGGTIGMKLNTDGVYVSEKAVLHSWLSQQPMFHDPVYAEKIQKISMDPPFIKHFREPPLYMPVVSGKDTKHIKYVVDEYQHLVDSANIDSGNMLQMALDIKRYYRKFDAFVILHGTDTMCYTAATLSFVLENLGKPIIITGAQIPIFETRSDGRENFMGALIMAASFAIPEVCVYFNNQLFRGNRSRKVSADTLDAFDSPNFPPLGRLEVHVTVYWDLVQRPSTTKPFNVHTLLSDNVAVLRVFPNISPAVVRAFLQEPIEGIVMQCYGAGNFPDENLELVNVLKDACDRGIIIVNTTQCRRGAVSLTYAGVKALTDAGVTAGYDMTSEAALAKLSYVLTKPWDVNEKRKFMSKNVIGELTTTDNLPKQRLLSDALCILGLDIDMVGKAVEDCATIATKTTESMSELRSAMILPLMCMTIKHSDLEALDKICQKYPGNVLTADYDRRTALHIAIREGTYAIIQYLLSQGASVHKKDSFNRTPLMEAIYARRFDVIELLRRSGAHLNLHPQELAIELNQAVGRGDEELITAFWNAGATLNVWDYCKRTPLHIAVLNREVKCVEFLLKHGANPFLQDDYNKTAMDLTVHSGIISMLDEALVLEQWKKIRQTVVREPVSNDPTSESTTLPVTTEPPAPIDATKLAAPGDTTEPTAPTDTTKPTAPTDTTDSNAPFKTTDQPSVNDEQTSLADEQHQTVVNSGQQLSNGEVTSNTG